MKRHVAAVVVVLTSFLVIDSHVDWVHQDDRRLLDVNGQRFDVRGWAAEQWLALRSDCTPVSRWPSNSPAHITLHSIPDSPSARAMLTAIQQHSLPDSQSARWLQLQQLGDWSVAEVAFDVLKPTLVVLRLQAGQWRVQDQAVWSGSTAPWHSGDFVRRYLRQQAPDLPQALLDCVSIDPSRYGAGPGGLGPVSALWAQP
jgi:hypothetical protein